VLADLPVLGICGWKKSGKTTLIEAALPTLREQGLWVAVAKHDVHGVNVDHPGKDSDRIFRAGADVLLSGPDERFLRTHRPESRPLVGLLRSLCMAYDLVLVEGHKDTPLPKVWLLGADETGPPAGTTGVVAALAPDESRPDALLALLDDWLPRQWLKTPVYGCILIGGKSSRMGTPKHLLHKDGRTWLESTFSLLHRVVQRTVIVGHGKAPEGLSSATRLPDVPGMEGPIAGVLSAMRWAAGVSWIVAACDLPDLNAEALAWLLSNRRPGVWASMPRLPGSAGVEPLLAHYDFRAHRLLEDLTCCGDAALQRIAPHPKVLCPAPPSHLIPAWRNVNEPAD